MYSSKGWLLNKDAKSLCDQSSNLMCLKPLHTESWVRAKGIELVSSKYFRFYTL